MWAIPIAFLLLALEGVSPLAGLGQQVAWMNGICAAVSVVFLAAAHRPLWETLWAWVIMFVFIAGYVVKTVVFTETYGNPDIELWSGELGWLTLRHVQATYPVIALAFVVFCLTAAVLARTRPTDVAPSALPSRPDDPRRERIVVVLLVTTVFSVVATILPPLLGFGAMGSEVTLLPFRVDAVITRFRTNAAPALLLWILWVTDQRKLRGLWLVALLALVALALGDGITRASRGSLILMLLPLLLLWAVTGTFTRRRQLFGAVMLLVAIALYPILSYQRTFRALGWAGPIAGLRLAMSIGPTESWLRSVALRIGTRVSGADGLWHITASSRRTAREPAPEMLIARSRLALDQHAMARFNTERIVGIDDPREGRPPGLLGALALVSGSEGGIYALLVLYLVAVWAVWWLVASLSVAPPALAFLANVLLLYSSEGGLGLQDPIAIAVSLTILCAVHRWCTRRSEYPRVHSGIAEPSLR